MVIGVCSLFPLLIDRLTRLIPIAVALGITFFVSDPAVAQENITYRLKWLINMSTVGDIVAVHRGCFEEQGLTVTLKSGGPERDAIRDLELGHADFGVASGDQVIQAISKGSPVVVIAQLFQKNPLQWVYFKNKIRIDGLTDLKNKTIGVTFGKNDEIIMRTLLVKSGLSDRQVRLYSVRLDYTPFYRGVADLWPVYINTQGVEIGHRLTASGASIAFLDPESYGVFFVANSVVTSKRLLEEHPERVQRFIKGLIKGWTTAVEGTDSDRIVEDVRQHDRDTSRDLLFAQLDQTRALVKPDESFSIGRINVPAWEQTETIMLANQQIDRPVNVGAHLRIEFVE